MIKVDRHTCGQHAFFSLHNGENEDDFRNMLKNYELPTPMRCIAPMEVVSGWQRDTCVFRT